MTTITTTQAAELPVTGFIAELVATETTKAVAKSVAQRAKRERFSFGPVWSQAVIDGKATDEPKILAHLIALKVAGAASDVKKLKAETVLDKLQAALLAGFEVVKVVKAKTAKAAKTAKPAAKRAAKAKTAKAVKAAKVVAPVAETPAADAAAV
jgi:hypothetical protein